MRYISYVTSLHWFLSPYNKSVLYLLSHAPASAELPAMAYPDSGHPWPMSAGTDEDAFSLPLLGSPDYVALTKFPFRQSPMWFLRPYK